MPAIVNDIHSKLNEAEVEAVLEADSLAGVQAAVARARELGRPLAVCGGRHAMGGQQFCAGGLVLDTRGLARVLALDSERGTIEVEAGIQWPALYAYLSAPENGGGAWAFAQKQTGADRLTLGGAIAANVHGRALTLPPIVADVESLVLVDASGEARTCSRASEPELFSLVVGGYGLFGVVYSVTLRLVPRRKVERVVEVRSIDGLIAAFDERVRSGFLYGDFQFATDPGSDEFLSRGVFSCYRPVPDDTPMPAGQRALSLDDWKGLLYLAHTKKSEAFERYAVHYLATSGQIYYSDGHQMGEYIDDYHVELDRALGAAHPATEMISELYVPRDRLSEFVAGVAEDFRRTGVDVIYGTIRLIERDDETFLPWARDRFACIIFNLHTEHTPEGLERSADAFRNLIDAASGRGGSYFLTYHRWATREQLLRCYPQFPAFLEKKLEYDPEQRFQSDWYRHYRELLA
ncbi:MAG TPA: FAD-binding oxidoreductase [Gaiellaceae bacterium]|nr:FAD-binding oxidoreductase [Gaiellaceae bacterium]